MYRCAYRVLLLRLLLLLYVLLFCCCCCCCLLMLFVIVHLPREVVHAIQTAVVVVLSIFCFITNENTLVHPLAVQRSLWHGLGLPKLSLS